MELCSIKFNSLFPPYAQLRRCGVAVAVYQLPQLHTIAQLALALEGMPMTALAHLRKCAHLLDTYYYNQDNMYSSNFAVGGSLWQYIPIACALAHLGTHMYDV